MGLVVRLYAAALRHTQAALEAERAAHAAERGQRISRVLAIVGELRGSLDLERGAEIAQNLEALYEFVSERLLDANRGDGQKALQEVLDVLRPLHQAWCEVEAQPAPEKDSSA